MKRLWAIAVVGAAACARLNDPQYERAAESAYALIQPGMSVGEVVPLTETLVERKYWGLVAERCQNTMNYFAITFSEKLGGYVVETVNPKDPSLPSVNSKLIRERDLLVEALAEKPLNTCQEFYVRLGYARGVPFETNGSGRVQSVSRPVLRED